MKTVLFTRLLNTGKLHDAQAFLNECFGPKEEEYKDLLLRYSLHNTKIWFQTLEGKDYMIFTHDMDDDGMEKLKTWGSSTHPFDQWFSKQLENCFDLENEPEQPVFYSQFIARK